MRSVAILACVIVGWLGCSSGARRDAAAPPPVATAAIDGGAVAAPVAPLAAARWTHDELAADDDVCARRDDGRVMCWGPNNHGEVGDERGVPHAVPILVPGVRDVAAIAMGPSGTCAARRDGAVWCWGSYAPGGAPAAVAGVGGAVEVAVTSLHRCARRADGAVWCWSSYDGPSALAVPAPLPELAGARRLVGGTDFVCAALAAGDVRCALFPLPRDGGARAPLPGPVFLDVPDARGAVQLAAAFRTACATLAGGGVRCWTLTGDDGLPGLQVATVAGVDDAIDLVAGSARICAARRAGGAACFPGWVRPGVTLTAEPADALRRFRAIAFAMSATCAIEAGGRRLCWGEDYGPLGRYGAREARPTPVAVAGVRGAVELAVEDEGACARLAGGDVRCWDEADASRPIAGVRADRLFAGHMFTCATRGGAPGARCWGTRSWDDCRWDSPDNCQFVRLPAPTDVPGLLGLAGAVALADPCVIDGAGAVTCKVGRFRGLRAATILGVRRAQSVAARCAVDGDGAVACWPPIADDGAPAPGPTAITPIAMPPAREVVAGARHACALATDGTVWCWGAGPVGQLGDGTRAARDAAAPVGGLAGAVQLAAGHDFTCARLADGSVRCWGSNRDGALGDGSGRDQLRPVAVHGLGDAVELRASGGQACARGRAGDVVCWGHHRGGDIRELGVDEAVEVLAPDAID